MNINLLQTQAAIYLRVSSKDQESNTSIRNQLNIAQKFCDQNKLSYSDEFVYKDILSASTNSKSINLIENNSTSRPEFNRLLSDAALNKFSTVVVYSHDRLSRNIYESLMLKTYFKKLKIEIKYCKPGEEFNSNNEAMNNFFENLLNNIAEFESNLIGKRVKLGNEYNVRHNYWPGGPTPYGYSLVPAPSKKGKSVLIIKISEAKVVQEIFDLYALGNSPEDIAVIIKDKYKSEVLRKWTKNTIISILKNETYNGKIVWNKKGGARNPKKHEELSFVKSDKIIGIQIISDDLWESVKQIRDKVNHNPKILSTPFILKDLLICSNCGKFVENKNYGTKKGRVYYCKCNNTSQWEYSIKAYLIEEKVFKELKSLIHSILHEENNFEKFYESYKERLTNKNTQCASSIIELQKELTELREILSKCDEDIVENDILTNSNDEDDKLKPILKESINELQSYLSIREKKLRERLKEEQTQIRISIPTKDMLKQILSKNQNLLEGITAQNNNSIYNNTLRLLMLELIDCIYIKKSDDSCNLDIIIK